MITKITIAIALLLAALAVIEVLRWARQKMACPQCGCGELAEYRPNLYTCKECGYTAKL